jgi:SAM-dependent methyltransferase
MTVEQTYTAAELEKLYEEEYFHGREYMDYEADKAAQQKTLARQLPLLRQFVPTGGRLLEIGCAYGYFLELIEKLYPRSVGVDIAAAAVAGARARGLDARAGELLEMSFDEPFDGVCLWDTIEHLPRPFEVVRRAGELLRPGGHLFLSTGDFGAWLPRWQGLKWRQIHPPTHLFYFTRPSLRALCGRVGLVVERFGTVRVYRRLRSALQALERFHSRAVTGRVASVLLRALPHRFLDWNMPLNLGDTLCLIARK